MPYLNEENIKRVQDDPTIIKAYGDLNYFLTMQIINFIKQHGMRYDHIHMLYRDFVLNPEKNSALMTYYHAIKNTNITRSDMFAAASLAFFEFYRRIGSKYEDKKIKENGDVYKEVLELLDAPSLPVETKGETK